MVLTNRILKVHEIGKIMGTSHSSMVSILNDHIDMRKPSACWVPCLLANDNRRNRMPTSRVCLALFNYSNDKFWLRFLTLDETWMGWVFLQIVVEEIQLGERCGLCSMHSKKLSLCWQNPLRILRRRCASENPLFQLLVGFWYVVESIWRIRKIFFTKAYLLSRFCEIQLIGSWIAPLYTKLPKFYTKHCFLFSNLKKLPGGKRFRFNCEIIAWTYAYFEGSKNFRNIERAQMSRVIKNKKFFQ